MLMAPIPGKFAIPWFVRVGGVLAIAFGLKGSVGIPAGTPIVTAAGFAVIGLGEVLVGFLLGLTVSVIAWGAAFAGGLIGLQSPLEDSSLEEGQSEFGPATRTALLLAGAVFFAAGGHRQAVAALCDSYFHLPVGASGLSHAGSAAAVLASECCSMGLRMAAPVLMASLAAQLSLSATARIWPSIAPSAGGATLQAPLVLAGLAALTAVVAWMVDHRLEHLLDWFQQLQVPGT
jgi:flagellar biosynthesis protein FliR